MTRAEELSQTLRFEYLYCERYRCRQQENKLLPGDETRLRKTIEAIANAKRSCKEDLPENEYPEEYYYDDPFIPESSEKLMVVNKIEIPEGDGIQMNIQDYIKDGKICWR